MYFIPQQNRLYRRLIVLSRWQRIGLTTTTICLIVCCWFFCLYAPIRQHINRYDIQAKNARMHANKIATITQQCNDLETSITARQNQLNNQRTATKGVHYLPTITQQARQSGICCDTCMIESAQNKNDPTTRIAIDGHGTLAQLTNFVSNLSSHFPQIETEQLTLSLIKGSVYHVSMNLALQKPS